jgi:hypothetical protein
MILPISYNYANGVVTIWKSLPELELLNTTNISLEESSKQNAKVKSDLVAQAQAKRGDVPPLDKVMLQATVRDIKVNVGGPGKLFPIVNRAFTKLDILQQLY